MGETYFSDLSHKVRSRSADRVIRQLTNLLARGPVEAASKFKKQRLATTRFLAGTPITIEGIRQDSSLLPRILTRELRKGVKSECLQSIRWSLTLLSISRMILGGTPVDLDSITKPWGGHETISDHEYLWFYNKIQRPRLSYEMKSFFWSTKSGPNGPALIYSMVDLLAIKRKPKLIKALMHFMGHKFAAFFDHWLKVIDERYYPLQTVLKLKKRKVLRLRKLSVKPDKEAKSRVFAILDYWSQSALKGLHEELFKLLRKLPADKTFNQGGHLAKMAAKTSNHSFHSLDLSSATDRFPLLIQKKLLALLTSVDTANAWEEIMVGDGFFLPETRCEYKYSTGQPMGAHSSWPLFTLSHHLIVQVAAYRARVVTQSLFADYCLLGDDIVIHNDDVAREYKKILESYDVPISEAKSHVSKNTFEFAKRWFS